MAQALKEAKSNDPVLLLDEIDKMCAAKKNLHMILSHHRGFTTWVETRIVGDIVWGGEF